MSTSKKVQTHSKLIQYPRINGGTPKGYLRKKDFAVFAIRYPRVDVEQISKHVQTDSKPYT